GRFVAVQRRLSDSPERAAAGGAAASSRKSGDQPAAARIHGRGSLARIATAPGRRACALAPQVSCSACPVLPRRQDQRRSGPATRLDEGDRVGTSGASARVASRPARTTRTRWFGWTVHLDPIVTGADGAGAGGLAGCYGAGVRSGARRGRVCRGA